MTDHLLDFVLFLILLISLVTDLRRHKIYNSVTLPAVGLGLTWHTGSGGWTGFLFSGEGMLLGFGLLLVPYLLGGMGAGDVKLLAAVGALTGPAFVFSSFLYSSMIGGVIALIIIIRSSGWKQSLLRIGHASLKFRSNAVQGAFPYGVAIAIGTLAAYLWRDSNAF
jgi:prepilin peptidase CpaA